MDFLKKLSVSLRVVRVQKFIYVKISKPLRLCGFALSLLALASCAGPAPAPVTPTASPASAAPSHAPEIRFALVGQPTDINVWALFDEHGASYVNHALHSDEYPRLYRLSVPERKFEPYTADGMPSNVTQEGAFYVATARLKPGLKWSDGSPLSAQDAAFTINTALAFHLSLDWLSAYNPELLDHIEALDDLTVKFFFKAPFNVGDWQYGALQGPIVNQAYWSSKVSETSALLPSQALLASLETVQAEVNTLEARVDADNAQLLTTQADTATHDELSARVVRNQNELNSVNSRLAQIQDEYDAALNAARAALFAVTDEGEPTFGPFLRAAQSGDTFTREVNSAYPFEKPNFDRAAYEIFSDQISAMAAFKNADVNAILDAQSLDVKHYRLELHADPWYASSTSVDFVIINPTRAILAKSTFRRVLFCAVTNVPVRALTTRAFIPISLYVQAPNYSDLCGVGGASRLEAVELLKSAGYTWQREPTETEVGEGLILPDGSLFPAITVLASSESIDPRHLETALYMEQSARELGIPLSKKLVGSEELRYAVYSSGDYDMAIVGYRLSAYPGYLCEWFQAPSPFEYGSDRLKSTCEAFNSTADLETARQAAFQVQSFLMEDLPFIPLYMVPRYEAFQNISYPFDDVLGGISGLYGAPALAIPAP
jgi:peptide/nickel transport system substrate-binding protein